MKTLWMGILTVVENQLILLIEANFIIQVKSLISFYRTTTDVVEWGDRGETPVYPAWTVVELARPG